MRQRYCFGPPSRYPGGIRVLCPILLIFGALGFGASRCPAEIHYSPSDSPWQSRLRLHVSGVSHHFSTDRSDLNELNYGLGCSYELGRFQIPRSIFDNTRFSLETEVYSDSFSQLGAAVGVAFQKPVWRFLDFGLRAGLIHEDNLREKHGFPILPYILPFVETRFAGPLNARVTFVPPISGTTGGFVAAQLIIRL